MNSEEQTELTPAAKERKEHKRGKRWRNMDAAAGRWRTRKLATFRNCAFCNAILPARGYASSVEVAGLSKPCGARSSRYPTHPFGQTENLLWCIRTRWPKRKRWIIFRFCNMDHIANNTLGPNPGSLPNRRWWIPHGFSAAINTMKTQRGEIDNDPTIEKARVDKQGTKLFQKVLGNFQARA